MLIDWFTVGAQFLNFLILVWLMKHFLYQPILNAIDVREKRIAKQVADADAKKADAEKQLDELQKKNKALDDNRADLLSKATDDAKAQREQLLVEARKEADGFRAAQAISLKEEQAKLGHKVSQLMKTEVFEITRKTLADLTTVSLEERLSEVFTRRLREISGNDKTALAVALKTATEPAVLTSTCDLPENQKAAIQNALNETFSMAVRLRFQVSPNDVSGIELTSGGQKVVWSIDQYLSTLDRKMGALLAAQAPAPKKPEQPDKSVPDAKESPAPVSAGTSAGK